MRVTILHPDLGIGGAERLIVDAALALQNRGHEVKVVTAHFNPSHSFKETEQLDIELIRWFPRTIFGSMWALCAYIRMCLAAFYICFCVKSDVILTDQVSVSLFVFRIFSSARLIFYCHYPDLLLTDRATKAKSLYRSVLDYLEEWSTGLADVICVNSIFTSSVVRSTFPSLEKKSLTVLYPTINTSFFDEICDAAIDEIPSNAHHIFTSLNRYEVKKNIVLALQAFKELQSMLSLSEFSQCHLVIAGGFDKNNTENITHYKELLQESERLQIPKSQVTFLKSPSDEVKVSLLRRSRAVLYTPHNEHFGIVPVESMYVGTPVIAVASGGPKESILDGETGFLVQQKSTDFASCMKRLIVDEELKNRMAEKGPARVIQLFSFESFSSRLDMIIKGEPVD